MVWCFKFIFFTFRYISCSISFVWVASLFHPATSFTQTLYGFGLFIWTLCIDCASKRLFTFYSIRLCDSQHSTSHWKWNESCCNVTILGRKKHTLARLLSSSSCVSRCIELSCIRFDYSSHVIFSRTIRSVFFHHFNMCYLCVWSLGNRWQLLPEVDTGTNELLQYNFIWIKNRFASTLF